jgi:ABC-type dipeptide/oligopeptide/nickel transport system permease subunit
MAVDTLNVVLPLKAKPSRSRLARVRDLPLLPLLIFGVVIVCGIFAPLLAPHNPELPNPLLRLRPPAWQPRGSWTYPLGTDPVGRDILSRLIAGAHVSLIIGFTVVFISGAIGVVFALISGYFQGFADIAIMRLTDAVISLPFLVIAVAIAGVVGQSLLNLIIILGLLQWAGYARVLRSEVLKLKQADFVTLARITGVPSWQILLKHILPNIFSTVIVLATLQLGIAIISAASLGFLGLGVPPPTAEWGSMLADGRQYISSAWWVVTMPGIAIALTVMAANFIGDWLRIHLDPKRRGL